MKIVKVIGLDFQAQPLVCVTRAATGSSDSASCGATTANSDVTSHYLDESSDSPSWTITKTGTGSTTTFNATDLTGGLVATISGTSITQHVADIRGNITLTTTTRLANATITSYDEYGNTTTDPKTRPSNAWHGQQQRTTNNTTGLIQMGVRLYNSITGLFLQQDPVHGGNPNTYTHPVDPINKMDLDGRCDFWDCIETITTVASVLAFVPGIGPIAGAVAGFGTALQLVHAAWKKDLGSAIEAGASAFIGFRIYRLGKAAAKLGRSYQRSVWRKLTRERHTKAMRQSSRADIRADQGAILKRREAWHDADVADTTYGVVDYMNTWMAAGRRD